MADGVFLWRGAKIGYIVGLGLLFQARMLFIGLIIYMMLGPVMTGLPIALVDVVVIYTMGLICYIPFALYVRAVVSGRTSSPVQPFAPCTSEVPSSCLVNGSERCRVTRPDLGRRSTKPSGGVFIFRKDECASMGPNSVKQPNNQLVYRMEVEAFQSKLEIPCTIR